DVVVGAELEPEHLVELFSACRQHDDRDVALAPEALADLEPVEAREHHVEDDEIDVFLREPLERLLAVACLDDAVAVPLERGGEQGLDRILVVYEENGRRGRHRKGHAGPQPAPTIAPRWKQFGPGRAVAGCVAALLKGPFTAGPSSQPLVIGADPPSYAQTLSVQYPSRVPGSVGASGAARWYQETIRGFGLEAEEDTWSEELGGPGTPRAPNVVPVVPGRSDETIVVVAHRDNAGTARTLGDNASGTAALIELARGFAPQGAGPPPEPQRTLVFVSTDAGAYGGAGAERFAQSS